MSHLQATIVFQSVTSRVTVARNLLGASSQVARTQWSVVPHSRLSTAAKAATRQQHVLQHHQGLEGRSLNYICRSADDRQRTVGASSTLLHSSDDDATFACSASNTWTLRLAASTGFSWYNGLRCLRRTCDKDKTALNLAPWQQPRKLL